MIYALWLFLRGFFAAQTVLIAENLALRQQLAVFKRSIKHPRIRKRDRIFWVWLSKIWGGWRSSLIIVQPDTVVRWHRRGFKLYWRWKSRKKRSGRPKIDPELRKLIRQMSKENPTWGTPRIKSELLLLGYDVADSTIDKYRIRQKKPPSQTWRTFLKNHMDVTAACDFFVVYTATFQLIFCFIIMRHDRRQIVHFNVTRHPTAEWTARQIIEAFPGDDAEPRYLLHDRDSIYGEPFRRMVKIMGIEEVRTAPKSPWQNPYCERVIGSIRRECLDRVIILGEKHLCRIMKDYLEYYHHSRPHLSLERNSPTPRNVQMPSDGEVISISKVGGLHHLYSRAG